MAEKKKGFLGLFGGAREPDVAPPPSAGSAPAAKPTPAPSPEPAPVPSRPEPATAGGEARKYQKPAPAPGRNKPRRPEFGSRAALVDFLKNKVIDNKIATLKLMSVAGGGHVGGAFSEMDVLVALYYHFMKLDPDNPKWSGRDRFILSKGHAGVGFCPVLCDVGFYPAEMMSNFNQIDSPFGMHPDMNKIPGVEMSTGSLGHGLSVGIGMALAHRLDKADWRIFVMLGDGECNEGSVWEAAMAAPHFKLGNLVAIVDRNKLCLDGFVCDIMEVEPFADKWKAFGWRVVEIDGHDMEQILEAFENLPPLEDPQPTVIISNTTKGKGVDFMENTPKWHYGGLDGTLEAQAAAQLDAQRPKGGAN